MKEETKREIITYLYDYAERKVHDYMAKGQYSNSEINMIYSIINEVRVDLNDEPYFNLDDLQYDHLIRRDAQRSL